MKLMLLQKIGINKFNTRKKTRICRTQFKGSQETIYSGHQKIKYFHGTTPLLYQGLWIKKKRMKHNDKNDGCFMKNVGGNEK